MKYRKPSFFNSINGRLVSAYITTMLVIMVILVIANNVLIEQYYIGRKCRDLIASFEKMSEYNDSEIKNEEVILDVIKGLSNRYALDVAIETPTGDIIALNRELTSMHGMIDSYINGTYSDRVEDGEGRIIRSTNDYTMSIITDIDGSEYIDICGRLSSGNYYIARVPMDGVDEYVHMSNRFYTHMGVLTALLSVLMATLLSRKITKPILEIADIADKMAHLQFERKYVPVGDDEISHLGDSINSLSESLEKTISELKSANVELTKDIERKTEIDEMRKEFLSNVTHELKTPIAIIQGYAEGLNEGIINDPDDVSFYCNVIRDEADKMNSMVKKLLTLNQLEFSNETVHMERFDIMSLINSHISKNQFLAKQEDITFIYPELEPIYVWGDEYKIDEIMSNYISNAINYCSGDKIIEIRITRPNSKVKIEVYNTGETIPEEQIGRIWEKFYKVDKSRTRTYGGSGIGLSIVAAACRAMGQSYGVENYAYGVGFWFELDS